MRPQSVLTAVVCLLAIQAVARYASADAGDDLYAVAAKHYAHARWELAAAEFASLVDRHADHHRYPEAVYYLGEAELQRDQFDAAEAQFAAFVRQFPKHELAAGAAARRGDIALRRGDHAASAQRYVELLQGYADTEPAKQARLPLATSLLALAERDTDRCAERLQRCVELFREVRDETAGGAQSEAAIFGLARTHHLQDQPEQAVPLYQDLVDASDATIAAQAMFQLGWVYAAETDHAKAASTFSTLVADHPQTTWAERVRGPLALQLARAGQWEAAEEAFSQWKTKWDDAAPDEAVARQLASVAEQGGRRQWAEQVLTALAHWLDDPDRRASHALELAQTQIRGGRQAAAVETLKSLLEESSRGSLAAAAASQLAALLDQRGHTDQAIDAYLSVEKRDAGHPRVPHALYAAARLLEAERQPDRAIALYQRLADAPAEAWPDFAHTDAALYQLAWLLDDAGQSSEAAQRFAQLYQKHRPSRFWADAAYRVAQRSYDAGELADARRVLAELVATDAPPNLLAHALFLDARAAQSLTGWAGMQRPLEQLLASAPDSELRGDAEFWLAEAAYQLDQHDEARRRFDGLAATSDLSHDRRDRIALRRAQLLAVSRQWAQAEATARSLLARPTTSSVPLDEVNYLLGRCLAAQARFDEARAAYRQATDRPPGNRSETAAMAQWMIGESYLHQEDYRAALAEYFRVEALYAYPRWQAAALLQAATCYQRLDQPEQARKLCRQIVEQYPQTMFVEQAHRRLEETRP